MSAASSTTQNPFEAARVKLIERLALLVTPKAIRTFPHPSDFEAVASYIREGAEIFDDWLRAIGNEVADNASHNIDDRCFDGAFTAAVDGNATFVCDEIAERLIEDRSEAA